MDHCVFCFHPAEPLLCRWEGTLRLEAADGPRRLLGAFSPRGEALLHVVEVEGECRSWPDGDGLVRAVTVYNRSSLPLEWVEVAPGGEVLPESLRIEGQPAERPELPGLAAGGQALFTWREAGGGSAAPLLLRYRYRFDGGLREGSRPLEQD